MRAGGEPAGEWGMNGAGLMHVSKHPARLATTPTPTATPPPPLTLTPTLTATLTPPIPSPTPVLRRLPGFLSHAMPGRDPTHSGC